MDKPPNARAASRRLVLLCGVAPALVVVALALWRPWLIAQMDHRVYDQSLRALPASRQDDSRVTIIDIDERSVAAVGQWPWGRDVLALLVTRLHEMGATVIALDVIFPESDRFQRVEPGRSDDTDASLAAALREAHVIVGYAFTFNDRTRSSTGCAPEPLRMPVVQTSAANLDLPAFRATGLVCSLPLIATAAQGSGFLNAVPDADGMLRRVPLMIEHQGRLYPALGLAAAMAATGAHPAALRLLNVNATSLVLDAREIPLDGRSNLMLRYRDRRERCATSPRWTFWKGGRQPLRSRTPLPWSVRPLSVRAMELRRRSTPSSRASRCRRPLPTISCAPISFRALPMQLIVEIAGVLALGIAAAMLVARFGLAWGSAASLLLLAAAWRGTGWA